MLVGSPGTRKSSCIKSARRILSGAGYNQFAADRTSKEKFLLDLEGDTNGDESTNYPGGRRAPGTSHRDVLANLSLGDGGADTDGIPREVFVVADEFNQFSGTGNLDFLSLLGSLWDWDDESAPYTHRFKNSKSVAIYQPTISMLGGNTHSSLQLAFPAQSEGQGFMSRLILVHSEPSGRKITFPKTPPERLVADISSHLQLIRELVVGPCSRTIEAERALDMIYRSWQELEDYRFKHYSTRRFTHLLKLCLTTTAMRLSTIIDYNDVLLANTILTWTEGSMHKALGEYGKSRHAEAAHAIMTSLYETRKPLSDNDLWKVVSRDLERRENLVEVLSNLVAAEKIKYVKEAGGFLPTQKPVDKKALHVDFSLLKEYKL
jgi:hypothetical protein